MTSTLDGLPELHARNYETRVFLDGETLKVVGSVRDTKPAGMYVDDDPDPLDIHHMRVILDVGLVDLTISAVAVEFDIHPHTTCPAIIDHYNKLVGLNVARGFTRQLRDLFGGPRGCAHTTALLQAMAPVVIQSLWSVRVKALRESGGDAFGQAPDAEAAIAGNLNTCHIWAEEGEHVVAIRGGEPMEQPIWITDRLTKLGRPADSWRSPMAKS